MEIRLLGAAPGLPQKDKHHSCVFCRTSKRSYLLDCGEGTSQQLLKYGLTHDLIDSIYISHLHPDHFAGLFMLLQMYYLQRRSNSLNIYLPEEVEKIKGIFPLMYTYQERFSFAVNFLSMEENRDEQIIPLFSDHLLTYSKFIEQSGYKNPMRSWSFVLDAEDKKVVFSSDIATLSHLKPYLETADLFILDALHPKAEEILFFIKEAKEKKIILTHGIANELLLELNKLNAKNVQIADEEDEIIL